MTHTYFCSTLLARSEDESRLNILSRAAEKLRAIVLYMSVLSDRGFDWPTAYEIGLPLGLHSVPEFSIVSVNIGRSVAW